MMLKKKNIFEKIDNYLMKRGHQVVFSIYLKDYNGNKIYIRLDYVKRTSVYKVVWFDLNFFNDKYIEEYVNMQTLTNFLATKLIDILTKMQCKSSQFLNDKIMGDQVEIVNYLNGPSQYIFDRFLPEDLKELIDPLVIVFSYLPRGMDCFLSEIFGKLDGLEEKFNYVKPYKFDLIKSNVKEIFKDKDIELGQRYFEEGRVSFLEKVNDKYIAVVDDDFPYLVILHQINNEFVLLWSNCKCEHYCGHIYAALLALRQKKFNNFYKVKYLGEEKSLLQKVTDGSFSLCFGIEDDKLLLVSNEGGIIAMPITKDGKICFSVIEDDDECSLSKFLEDYNK